jgi:hypothetical protein
MLRKIRLADVKDMPAPLFLMYLPQRLMLNFASVCWFSLRGAGNGHSQGNVGCSPGHKTHMA